MINDTFKACLEYEGIVSMTTWADGQAHVSNTWNSYLVLEDDKILIPAAWLHTTEKNLIKNNHLIITLGSHQVQGKLGMGTGFVLDGSAKFLSEGASFDMMKAKFSFLTRVLEVTVTQLRQTI
jgi:Pyridoxamine 5'-phosphate oxidase